MLGGRVGGGGRLWGKKGSLFLLVTGPIGGEGGLMPLLVLPVALHRVPFTGAPLQFTFQIT